MAETFKIISKESVQGRQLAVSERKKQKADKELDRIWGKMPALLKTAPQPARIGDEFRHLFFSDRFEIIDVDDARAKRRESLL